MIPYALSREQNSMVRLVIYDLDGTLIDSRSDIVRSVNRTLSDLGFSNLSSNQVSAYVGNGVSNLMRGVLKEAASQHQLSENQRAIEKLTQKAIKIYRKHYQEHMLDETRLYPNVEEVLKYYKGLKQAVMTNKPEEFSVKILQSLGVLGYFFRVIGGDQALPKKPDPKAVFELMRLAAATPSETVLVGDSTTDIKTGKAACVRTVAVTYGFGSAEELGEARPDLMIDDFAKLIRSDLFLAG